MFDLDSLIANKDLILKDRDNRADVQKVLSVYAEKVSSDYVVKAKWEDIFSALLQGMKVQAQVVTFTEADEEEETDASAVIETYELYDATVTADGFKVNGTDLSASSADAYPVGSLSRPSSGGGGGGSALMVTITDGAFDKTWQEVKDAVDGGTPVYVVKDISTEGANIESVGYITQVGSNADETMRFAFYITSDGMGSFDEVPCSCASADGYPAEEM